MKRDQHGAGIHAHDRLEHPVGDAVGESGERDPRLSGPASKLSGWSLATTTASRNPPAPRTAGARAPLEVGNRPTVAIPAPPRSSIVSKSAFGPKSSAWLFASVTNRRRAAPAPLWQRAALEVEYEEVGLTCRCDDLGRKERAASSQAEDVGDPRPSIVSPARPSVMAGALGGSRG